MKKLGLILTALVAGPAAMAQGEVAVASGMTEAGVFALAAAFTITFAAIGGAMAQGKAAAVALEGIARNPSAAGKMQTPMIISLALIESLVVYALVISFMIIGKF